MVVYCPMKKMWFITTDRPMSPSAALKQLRFIAAETVYGYGTKLRHQQAQRTQCRSVHASCIQIAYMLRELGYFVTQNRSYYVR